MFALGPRGLGKYRFESFKGRIPYVILVFSPQLFSAVQTKRRGHVRLFPYLYSALELDEPRFLHFLTCLPACSQDSVARLATNIHSSSSS
jgi:hypothetical protein